MERRIQPDFLTSPLPVLSRKGNGLQNLLVLGQCEGYLGQAPLPCHSAGQGKLIETTLLHIQFKGDAASLFRGNPPYRKTAPCIPHRNPLQFPEGFLLLGGNGSQKTANLLSEEGLNVIGLPKTIDNDLWGTDMTFGFQSAVNVATEAIDCIHTTAASHGRIFIVEVMGHKVGWLTLNAGIAGGADIILIPEIPYNIDSVVAKIKQRAASGNGFTILAVAEGAMSKKESEMSKKEYKQHMAEVLEKYPSVSYAIADKILKKTGREVRVTVPGHMQRGGSPCPYDRVFASRLGAEAGKLILDNQYGFMVGYKNREVVRVPLEDVAGKLKAVSPDASIVKEAKLLGICFGD